MSDAFAHAQAWLYEALFQPLVQALGLASQAAEVYEGAGWLLAGALQVAVIALGFGALERWRPVEPLRDRRSVRVDLIYTLLHRLGGFRLLLFFTLDPLVDALEAQGRLWGWQPLHLDALWPGVTDVGWVAFFLYLLVFDFAGYWLHRAQHRWRWWWALHALHHSQRQMTKWSDSRNHLLDDWLGAALLALLAVLLGTEPAQFMGIVLLTQGMESLQHANVRLRFGWLERWLVSPYFHRLHHGVGIGHEGPHGGCNFGVLLPWWDRCFGSAVFGAPLAPTGVRGTWDDGGFWAQQRRGVQDLWNALNTRR